MAATRRVRARAASFRDGGLAARRRTTTTTTNTKTSPAAVSSVSRSAAILLRHCLLVRIDLLLWLLLRPPFRANREGSPPRAHVVAAFAVSPLPRPSTGRTNDNPPHPYPPSFGRVGPRSRARATESTAALRSSKGGRPQVDNGIGDGGGGGDDDDDIRRRAVIVEALRRRLFGTSSRSGGEGIVGGEGRALWGGEDAAILRWLVRFGGGETESTGPGGSGSSINKGGGSNDGAGASVSASAIGSSSPWTSHLTRVPGCVATVHLQTTVRPTHPARRSNNNSADDDGGPAEEEDADTSAVVVSLKGTADAMVSRGLLVLLARLLENQSPLGVMELKPHQVTQRLGLSTLLSQGRNDGVASMIRTVQQHLREYLQETKQAVDVAQPPPSIISWKVPLYCAPSIAETTWNAVPDPVRELNAERRSTDPGTTPHGTSAAPNTAGKVALLLSGGVDSSVALHLLLRQGYDVTCYYLKIWLQDEVQHLGKCPWEDDYKVCLEVCQQANVRLRTVSLQDEYHRSVVQHSIREAEMGRTPNPDVLCNSRIKFGVFLRHLEEQNAPDVTRSSEFDYVASGHYAQVERDPVRGVAMLHRAPDPVKDQSYFLCALDQGQLRRLLFPIAHLQKHQVRDLALRLGLPNRSRPDSQGLCFLGKLKFDDFLASYLGERPGPIVDAATGDHLGTHRGVWYHTVGQRKGIGLYLDPKATSRGPWYVVAKDPRRDTVYCSNAYDESRYTDARSKVTVENLHWLAGTPPPSLATVAGSHEPRQPTSFLMKARHGPKLVSGTLLLDAHDPTTGDVQLVQVDSGLAPGQYLVFYNGTECLGGGIISERHWIEFVSGHHPASEKIANDTTTRALVGPMRS